MNLWHDDIRRPPSGIWDAWARTNSQACAYLISDKVDVISLDHDLGLHNEDPDVPGAVNKIGMGTETGRQLVMWMVMNDCMPDRVIIHTMNSVGGPWMEGYIVNAVKHGAISNTPTVTIEPFGIG